LPAVHHDNRRRGFTLIELIAVLVIIGVVLAMAAPSLRGFHRARRVDHASRYLIMISQYAHMRAVSDGRTYRLYFDLDAQSCRLADYDAQAGSFTPLRSAYGRTYRFDQGIELTWVDPQFNPNEPYLVFEPLGLYPQAHLRLEDQLDNRVDIASPSVTEPFRVVEEEEILEWKEEAT